MRSSLHFGATYAVKGKSENVEAHVKKLEDRGLAVRSHMLNISNTEYVKGFIATGVQDVSEFDFKKATTQISSPSRENLVKRQLKALLKSLSVSEFFAIIPKLQKKYEDNKNANPSLEWTVYENQNLPFSDGEYFPVSALNRALDQGKFDPETGIVAQNYDFFADSVPGEDDP